jgi:solute carrier family 35 protein C2
MFTTAVHFLVQFTLASLVLLIFPSMRPKNTYKSNMGQSRHESDPERPIMTKLFYLTRIGPCGVATGLDIGLGNTSLQFITLTFYSKFRRHRRLQQPRHPSNMPPPLAMCKSSSLAFVLIFAFLFRLESPTWKLVGIIGTMTLGVVMMVAGEVEFKVGGFVLVIAAAFFSGFRWALTQILLLRNPATSNPFSSIFFLAPVMFVTLVSIAIPVEGPAALLAGLEKIAEEKGLIVAPLIILFPGVIAFLMTASEFALLQRTSVVTLSIAGIFKEAVTISAAAIVFGDTMTPINIVGLLITLAAIATYNWIKINKMRSEAQTDVHRGHLAEADELASGSGSVSGSGSDRDDDQAEDVALLRRSVDNIKNDQILFTADGGDVVAGPGPEVSALRDDGQVPRDGRID